MSDAADLPLVGGTVLDPASGQGQGLDVRSCYVTPSLIDFHIQIYWGVNPYRFEADLGGLGAG